MSIKIIGMLFLIHTIKNRHSFTNSLSLSANFKCCLTSEVSVEVRLAPFNMDLCSGACFRKRVFKTQSWNLNSEFAKL